MAAKMLLSARLSGRNMHQAFVRNVKGESDLIISFNFGSKSRRMCRPKSQTLERTLHRMALTLFKEDRRAAWNNWNIPKPSVVTLLDRKGLNNVPVDTLNEAAWQHGTWFVVGEQKYEVVVNYPRVNELVVPPLIAGCPTIPQVEVEFADKDYCKWKWLRINDQSLINELTPDFEMMPIDYSKLSLELLHEGHIYYPTQSDVGNQLLLQCTPYNRHENIIGSTVYYLTSPIQNGVESKPIINRQKQTSSFLSSDSLRVVSYNILADKHASADDSHTLYPYCPPLALQTPFRHGLLITELLGYHPDVVCLQEVMSDCFELSLLPEFKNKGFNGIFARKTGKISEGEAVFFNSSKYELVEDYNIDLKQYIQLAPSCKPLLEALESGANSVLKSFLLKPTILQLVLLKVKEFENKYLLVANTHLCFHPTERCTRLSQAIVCTRAISDIIAKFKATLKESEEIGVIFCGDFNSCPCTAGYQYLTSGFISKSHPDWTNYKLDLIPQCGCSKVPSNETEFMVNMQDTLVTGEELEADDDSKNIELNTYQIDSTNQHHDDFNGLDVSHEFKFRDACGPLDYTHYRDVFVAVLDYILIDESCLEVQRVIPMPSHDEVTEHVALPSVSFPSDHLAVICELKWK